MKTIVVAPRGEKLPAFQEVLAEILRLLEELEGFLDRFLQTWKSSDEDEMQIGLRFEAHFAELADSLRSNVVLLRRLAVAVKNPQLLDLARGIQEISRGNAAHLQCLRRSFKTDSMVISRYLASHPVEQKGLILKTIMLFWGLTPGIVEKILIADAELEMKVERWRESRRKRKFGLT